MSHLSKAALRRRVRAWAESARKSGVHPFILVFTHIGSGDGGPWVDRLFIALDAAKRLDENGLGIADMLAEKRAGLLEVVFSVESMNDLIECQGPTSWYNSLLARLSREAPDPRDRAAALNALTMMRLALLGL